MLFEVYDGRNPRILDNNSFDIEAGTARQALQQYLSSRDEGHLKFHNTADRNVIWRTTPYTERDGRKYHAGRVSWWALNG